MNKITTITHNFLSMIGGGNGTAKNLLDAEKLTPKPQLPNVSIQGEGNDKYVQATITTEYNPTPKTKVGSWIAADTQGGIHGIGIRGNINW